MMLPFLLPLALHTAHIPIHCLFILPSVLLLRLLPMMHCLSHHLTVLIPSLHHLPLLLLFHEVRSS